MMYSNNRKLQTGHGGKGGVTLSTHAWTQTYGQKTHLIVESGEVCVPSENNPALIWSLSDQDLKNLWGDNILNPCWQYLNIIVSPTKASLLCEL